MVSLGSVNGSLQPVHFLPMDLAALVRIATTPGGALGIARRSSDTIDVLPNISASLIPPDGFRAAVKRPAVVEEGLDRCQRLHGSAITSHPGSVNGSAEFAEGATGSLASSARL